MDYINRPVFSIDHDVSETGSVSVLGPMTEISSFYWTQLNRFYSATST
jgi:hypothetical protein